MKGIATVAIAATLLAGCAGTHEANAVPALHKYAAFDLNCPQEQLQIMEIGSGLYGVKGCSRRAQYRVQSCNAITGDCTITRQGEIERD